MTIHARRPDAFGEASRSVATRFAPCAAVAAGNLYAYQAARDLADSPERAPRTAADPRNKSAGGPGPCGHPSQPRDGQVGAAHRNVARGDDGRVHRHPRAVRRSPAGGSTPQHSLCWAGRWWSPRHAWSVALVGVTLLAGCASTPAAPGAAAAASSPADAARAAAQYASNAPPVSAQMPCGDEIRGEVADALGLDSVPPPQGTWTDHIYRCTYALPVGQLVMSVTVTPSDAAARTDLATMRTRLAAGEPEPGVGRQAYGNAAGILVAAKDNMVLDVDATGLPDDLGATHERRSDFAQVIASGVFTCWAGE